MKVADLYIRVSTDEQADKGYSQRDQEERLRKHCSSLNITIDKIIYEDHSAKTFERPEWKKYLFNIKKGRGSRQTNSYFSQNGIDLAVIPVRLIR